MTTSLPKQISAKELAIFEKQLSTEIAKLRSGVAQLQSNFDEDKIEVGVYANSCNTMFNAFIQKLQNHFPEAILKTFYPEHHPLEETQSGFQREMSTLQHSKSNYELDEDEFAKEVVALYKRFLVILARA